MTIEWWVNWQDWENGKFAPTQLLYEAMVLSYFILKIKPFITTDGADLIGRLGKRVRWRTIGTQRLWSFARRLADEGQRRTNPALPMAEITSQSNSPTNNRFFSGRSVRSDQIFSFLVFPDFSLFHPQITASFLYQRGASSFAVRSINQRECLLLFFPSVLPRKAITLPS